MTPALTFPAFGAEILEWDGLQADEGLVKNPSLDAKPWCICNVADIE